MITGITDYTTYPLVPRGGIVQLMYRPGESAFHVALASNTDSKEWEAENLCRPFLRLPFDGSPKAISHPGSLTLTDGKLTMVVRRSPVLHTVHVTVTSPQTVKLHCGPAGRLDYYGYTEGQASNTNFYHGYPDEAVESGCWLSHRREWTGALHPGRGKIVKWGIGVTVELPSGQSILSFSAGKSKEDAMSSASKVVKISADEAEAYLVKIWEAIMSKVPEIIHKLPLSIRMKAIEAIYLMLEDTRYEPLGIIRHPAPVNVMTGYRTPTGGWDCTFSAVSMSRVDPEYAIGILLNVIENAYPEGNLPCALEPNRAEGITTDGGSKEIYAWGAYHLWKNAGLSEVLEVMLPGLIRHYTFIQKYIDSYPDALVRCWQMDDNSPGDDPTRYITDPESIEKAQAGLKELFGGTPPVSETNDPRNPVISCDPTNPRSGYRRLVAGAEVSGSYANNLICMARMCAATGRDREAGSFVRSAKLIASAARKYLWDAKVKDMGYMYGKQFRLYNNCHRFLGAPAMPKEEVRETMRHALRQGGPLWPRYGIATVGADEPAFDPNQIWRGPIWPATSYLLAESCAVMGLTELSEGISQTTQELVTRNAGFWECHNPLTGQGHRTQLTMGLNAAAFLMFCQGMHRTPAWVRPEELA